MRLARYSASQITAPVGQSLADLRTLARAELVDVGEASGGQAQQPGDEVELRVGETHAASPVFCPGSGRGGPCG